MKKSIIYIVLIFIVVPIILSISLKLYSVNYAKSFQSRVQNECLIMSAIAQNDLVSADRLIRAGEEIDAKAPNGWTALVFAARENRKDALILLLKAGANPNMKDNLNWSPLHHAILTKSANNDAIKILVKYGADVNIRDSHLRSPLHRAAQYGHYQTVKLLLNNGADPLAKDENGMTPADRGARYPEIVKLLESIRR